MLGVRPCARMPEERVLDVSALDDLRDDVAHGVARDGEADAEVALLTGVAGRNLRVDADHLAARVEQRPAGVAVVQRGVGLDRVLDREVVRRGERPVDRADDPGGHRARVAEGIADRDDGVADLRVVRVAPDERRERARVRRAPASTAMSVDGSEPTMCAFTLSPFEKLT